MSSDGPFAGGIVITRIAVKGIRSLRDVVLPLASGVTVLVGANNSGKSNALTVLRLLRGAADGTLEDIARGLGGWPSLRTRPGDGNWLIGVTARDGSSSVSLEFGCKVIDGQEDRYVERLRNGDDPHRGEILAERAEHGRVAVEGASVNSLRFGSVLEFYVRNAKSPVAAARTLRSSLRGIVVADLSADALRAPAQVVQNAKLDAHGRNLAAALDWLEVVDPAARARVDQQVTEAASDVKRVITAPALEPGHKVVAVVETNEEAFTADQMSDGLVLFVGLATLIEMESSRPTVIAIEEPERGIHPRRIREVLEQIRRVASKGVQVVITTHSPVLLDEMRDEPESVLVFDRTRDGSTVSRLSDNSTWLSDLERQPLGDLWFSGVFGGVPSR